MNSQINTVEVGRGFVILKTPATCPLGLLASSTLYWGYWGYYSNHVDQKVLTPSILWTTILKLILCI